MVVKIIILFWLLNILRHLLGDPTRDHNFDNHPYTAYEAGSYLEGLGSILKQAFKCFGRGSYCKGIQWLVKCFPGFLRYVRLYTRYLGSVNSELALL